MNRMRFDKRRLCSLLVQYRLQWAALAWLITFAVGAGISQFHFTPSIQSFFDTDNPRTQAFMTLEKQFGVLKNSLVYVLDFGDAGVYNRDGLTRLRQATDTVIQSPHGRNVTSLSNVLYTWSDGDDLMVDQWFPNPARMSDATLAERIRHARQSSFLAGRMVSDDGRVATIYSEIVWRGEHPLQELQEVVAHAEEVKRQLEQAHPGLQVYLTGDVMLQSSLLGAASQSLIQLYPIIMLLGTLILWYCFRSVLLITSGFAIVIASTLFTLGAAGWSGVIFNDTSVLAVILVFVIVLADMVHINTSYLAFLQQGDDKLSAMQKSLEVNLVPIFLTSLTTTIGFLCLNTCVSPPLRTMGNLASVGIVSGFFFTLFLLPAAVTLFNLRLPRYTPPLRQAMDRLADFVIRHPTRIIVATLVISLCTVPFIPLNRFHDDPITYFKAETPFRQAIDFTTEHLTERQQLIFSIHAASEQGTHERAFVQTLDRFQDWLRQQPEVSRVMGYPDLLKTLNRTLHGDQNSQYRLPEDSELIAQYLLLYEMSVPEGQGLTDFLSHDRQSARVTVVTRPLQSDGLIALEQRSRQWLEQQLPGHRITHSSIDLLFAHLSQDVVSSMISGSLLSVILIALCLQAGVRSVRYGLISLIPNALPAAIVYGLWGLLSGKVNMAVAVTFSMSLGIIVDDTVHVLSKYLHALRKGMTPEQALRSTLHDAGVALVITSAIIASGLLVLTLSDYGVHAIMGLITAPIILLALALDLLLLPAILLKMSQRTPARPQEDLPSADGLLVLPASTHKN